MKKTIFSIAVAVLALASCGDKNCVDLGLPSGNKWAAANIGAENPLDIGFYLTWGGLESKESYYEESDRFCTSKNVFTKYNEADGLMQLQEEDDIATITLGKGWHTPTNADFQELFDNCTCEFIQVGEGEGVNYFKFTGKNGKFITIPAGGDFFASFKPTVGKHADLWTSDLRDFTTGLGVYICDKSCRTDVGSSRYIGHNVRPVFKK